MLPGMRGPPFTRARPRPPAQALGRMVACSGQEAKNLFFFFQILCSMFGEGKGGLLKWLMHCSLQLECLPPGSLFSAPGSHTSRSCVLLWVHNLFSEDKQGTSSGFSVLALVFAAPWGVARLVLRLGSRKGRGWTENLRREGGGSEQM